MSLIFPDGATAITSPIGTEKMMGARMSDGKIIYISYSVFRAGLQASLVSGTNIKTFNGGTILGSGNIEFPTETADTIKNKLGITTLSGSNTGDQDLSGKVDKVNNKSLISDSEITRLASVTNQDISGKVDKVSGKSLISDSEITRLASVTNQDLSGKQNVLVSGNNIKTINGNSLLGSGNITISGEGGSGPSNTDELTEGTTNLYFTVARVLASLLSGFTAGNTYTALAASDSILGAFQKIQGMLTVIKTKLDGIANNATANSTDAQLRDRSTHTGSQSIGTITNLQNTLDAKADLVGGLVPSAQLPSYVDDVLEFSNLAALPATGETGKIYITQNNNYQYRWSGSAYIQLVASPGTSDNVPEGTTNLYWTLARTVGSLLTGYVAGSTHVAVVAGDTIMQALQKLSGSIVAINSTLLTKQDLNLTTQANTASYTLVLANNGKTVTQNVASANNVTVPQNSSVAFPIGCTIPIVQLGAGQVTIVAGTGTTLRASVGLKLRAQYSMAFIHKIAANEWIVGGDVVA